MARFQPNCVQLACAFALLLTYCGISTANEIYSPVVSPVVPSIVDAVPDVSRVPGKEYTDTLDLTHVPTPHMVRPTQIGVWDGLGGAKDGLLLRQFAPNLGDFHIDAQSQIRDTLFDPVTKNQVPLVVSASFDSMLGQDVALAAEHAAGPIVPFARRPQVVGHPHMGGLLRDIDSVDLWGPEDTDHAGFYSFQNDPGGTAVWSHTILAVGGIFPYLSTADIATAIGNPDLEPFIDVDALMARDVGTGFNPFDNTFGPGDSIMFSIAPIIDPNGGVIFDGGEIWVWEHGSPAQFLDHGGHLWDTAFDVAGALGINTQNIDALEAVSVPEASSLVLALMAMVGAATRRRT